MRRLLSSLTVAFLLAGSMDLGAAAAQSASETAVARRAYQAGMQAARDGRWQDARASFERAYRLVGRPRILVNLATAQAQTGQLVEGAESYRRFLREAKKDSGLRPKVERELEELEKRIPELTIYASGLQSGDRLEVDGDALSRAIVGAPVPLNPGAHEITVTRDGQTVASASVELEEEERRDLRLEVSAEAGAAGGGADGAVSAGAAADDAQRDDVLGAEPDTTDAGEHEGGVLSSPWLWTAVGLVVVAGAATAVGLTVGGEGPSPHTGNVPPGTYEP